MFYIRQGSLLAVNVRSRFVRVEFIIPKLQKKNKIKPKIASLIYTLKKI